MDADNASPGSPLPTGGVTFEAVAVGGILGCMAVFIAQKPG